MRVRVLPLVVCGLAALAGAARADDESALKKLRDVGDSVSDGALGRMEEQWGTVAGQITWADKMPPPGSEKIVVSAKNKGLKNVFVWLTDPDDGKKSPPVNRALKAAREVTLTITGAGAGRHFEPRALAVRDGQTIRVKNDTHAPGDVKFDGPGAALAYLVEPRKDVTTTLEPSPRVYVIYSSIFPAMRGYVRVFDHPYFAVTDNDGKYEIKGAPAGSYNIVLWHEETGWVNGGKRGRTITIPAGKVVEVNEKAKPAE
jgi:hypothetical protein